MAEANYIQSVLKAAQMLKIVGESEYGVKLSEIAKAMDQKLPAIHHLSKTLISCGFLQKSSDNVLTLGEELVRLASKSSSDIFVDAASPELTRLYNLYPEGVVILARVNPPRVETILRISYERPSVIQKETGQIHNIYVNAVALAALALVEDSAKELMMDKQPFSEYGMLLWKSSGAMNDYLAGVRRDRIAISPFDRETSFRVAVPITGKNGKFKGALGINLAASKMKSGMDLEIICELKKSAEKINSKIASF